MGIIESLFLANCGITVASYLPQLIKLFKDKTDSASVSLGSWMIWVYTAAVGFIYALFKNGDLLFILSAGFTMFFCAFVLSIAAFNRYMKFKIAGRDNISLLDMMSSRSFFIFSKEPKSRPVSARIKFDE